MIFFTVCGFSINSWRLSSRSEIPTALGVVQTGNTEPACARMLGHPCLEPLHRSVATPRTAFVCPGANILIDIHRGWIEWFLRSLPTQAILWLGLILWLCDYYMTLWLILWLYLLRAAQRKVLNTLFRMRKRANDLTKKNEKLMIGSLLYFTDVVYSTL